MRRGLLLAATLVLMLAGRPPGTPGDPPARSAAVPAPAGVSPVAAAIPAVVPAAAVAAGPGNAPRAVPPRLTELALGSLAAPAAGAAVRTDPAGGAGRVLALRRAHTPEFAALGVTWRADPAIRPVQVLLRHRYGAGTWSAWHRVGPADAEPDPPHPDHRGGTDPVWTGRSDAVEVAVSAAPGATPRDVRLTLIDPGRSPADAVAEPGIRPAEPATAAGAGDGAGTASAAVRPGIYTRAQWGADPRLMGWDPEYSSTIKAGFLHHTVNPNGYAAAEVPAMLRAIYAYHSRTRGWGDIGYNFIVDRFGRIWEGRYGGIDSTVIGAHTGGFNAMTFGAAMLGTYSAVAVPPPVLTALAGLFAWKLARHYRNPIGSTRLTSAGGGTSRYPRGTVVTKPVIAGHRDVGSTACPGAGGYGALAALRSRVAGIMGTGLLDPVVAPRSVPRAGPGPRVAAALWRPSSWAVTVTAECPARPVRRYLGTGTRIDRRWDLTDAAGRRVRPGAYLVTITASAGGRAAVPYSQRVIVAAPPATPPIPPGTAPEPGPAGYVPITPVRVLDSRTGLGGAAGLPLTAGGRVDVPVLGVGEVPPTGVAAVVLAVAGTCSTGPNWVLAGPAGAARPAGPVLPIDRATSAGAPTVVPVGADGRVSVAALRPMLDVIVEVVGYLPLTGGAPYHPVPPRTIVGAAAPLQPGETRLVDVRALAAGAVPATATAVSGTLHALAPGGAGVLRLWPAGRVRPVIPSLRYAPGRTEAALVLPALPGTGKLWLHNAGRTAQRVRLDLDGWFGPDSPGAAGARFTAVPRTRVADTSVGPDQTRTLPAAQVTGAPPAATAVLLQVTALAPVPSALTLFPGPQRPPTPQVDLTAGRWMVDPVLVPLAADGTVAVHNASGTARLALDVLGYFS